jgi:hypothetical protein
VVQSGTLATNNTWLAFIIITDLWIAIRGAPTRAWRQVLKCRGCKLMLTRYENPFLDLNRTAPTASPDEEFTILPEILSKTCTIYYTAGCEPRDDDKKRPQPVSQRSYNLLGQN